MVALSIAKLRVGAEAYQLSGIAQSLQDYYTGNGEAPGQWVGHGSPTLGLTGDVKPEDLRAVLAGLTPGGSGLSPNGTPPLTHPRRVPGFDLTFKIPKSVSVLYAVSDDPQVQGAIIQAGNTAVEQAINWLEKEAIRVRRGSNNQPWVTAQRNAGNTTAGIQELPTRGLVAASFRHRTSRAGDPFLHWHVLASNMVQGEDGKWSSFVHPNMYQHARAAGEIFQTIVRDELTRTLGLQWRPGNHVHEVAGIPDQILRTFSKRRAEIEAWTTATGTPDDPAGNQAAALATRKTKAEKEATIGLSQRWRHEATEAGWGPEQADQLLRAGQAHEPAEYGTAVWRLPDVWFDPDGRAQHYERTVDPEEWIRTVLRQDLTANRTTFTKADVSQAVANRLGQGATLQTVERVTSRVLASTQTLPVQTQGSTLSFTSRELTETATRFINHLNTPANHSGLSSHLGPSREAVDAVLVARQTIGADQANAVRTLTQTQSAVSVMIGPAGTGKTFALDAVREAYEQAGWTVIGAAPSARAAHELEAGAHIRTSTIHSLLGRIERGLVDFGPNTVLVIDEAGMADIRTLERLTNHAVTAGARVALVGDHRQLPEVGAGGGFAFAAKQSRNVSELATNRRQQTPWEQQALDSLRDGDVAQAVTAYFQHGRVRVAADGPSMIDTAVTAWFDAHASGVNLVLQAGTNEMVDRLNTAVLDRLAAPGGPLHGAPQTSFAGKPFRVGERVVVRRNFKDMTQPDVHVSNGQAGIITAISDRSVSLLPDGETKTTRLGEAYLAAGGTLSHAYAYTTHRTQGGTWDASIAVGLDGLYREGAYTALSRGRHGNVFVLTDPQIRELEQEHQADVARHDRGLRLPSEELPNAQDQLLERITVRRGKQLAHAVDPDHQIAEQLTTTIPYPQLVTLTARAVQVERVATDSIGTSHEDLSTRITALEELVHGIAPGALVKASDRDNIGTVLAVDDRSGSAKVRFESADRRRAVKVIAWDQLTIVDQDQPRRPLTDVAQTWLTQRTGGLQDSQDKWTGIVASLGGSRGDAQRLARAAELRVSRATSQLSATVPVWLTHQLGSRPISPERATRWDNVVRQIAAYRLQNDLAEDVPSIGQRPTEPGASTQTASNDWDRVNQRILESRLWFVQGPGLGEPQWPIVPSRQALLRRQTDVNAILATAPTDQRDTIDRLRAGQLSLQDSRQLLTEALGTQDERQVWILENWPHVVEAAEIYDALSSGRFGPSIQVLGDYIAETTGSPALSQAARSGEPWFAAALNALAEPRDQVLSERSVHWLEAVVEYRHKYGTEGRDPLGTKPINRLQAEHFGPLLDAMDSLTTPPIVEPLTLASHEPGTQKFEKYNGQLLDALATPGEETDIEGLQISTPEIER